jgi:hypothetical protein
VAYSKATYTRLDDPDGEWAQKNAYQYSGGDAYKGDAYTPFTADYASGSSLDASLRKDQFVGCTNYALGGAVNAVYL